MYRYILLIIALLLSLILNSATIPIPESYPSSMPSARIMGMGGAGAAIVPSAEGVFWNPAALGYLNSVILHFSFSSESNSSLSDLIEKEPTTTGKNLSFVSLATFQGALSYYPIYSAAYSGIYFPDENVIRDLDISLNEYILTVTTFAGSNEAYDVPFVLGFNLKYLNGKFAEAKLFLNDADTSIADSAFADISTGHGYGLDAGLIVNLGALSAGLMFRDLLTHVYWSGEDSPGRVIKYDKQIIPIFSTLGFSYSAGGFLGAFEINRIFQSGMPYIYRIGAEYTFNRTFNDGSMLSSLGSGSPSVRLGASLKEFYGLEPVNFTMGIGYSMNFYRIDMAIEGKPENYMHGGLNYQLSINLPLSVGG